MGRVKGEEKIDNFFDSPFITKMSAIEYKSGARNNNNFGNKKVSGGPILKFKPKITPPNHNAMGVIKKLNFKSRGMTDKKGTNVDGLGQIDPKEPKKIIWKNNRIKENIGSTAENNVGVGKKIIWKNRVKDNSSGSNKENKVGSLGKAGAEKKIIWKNRIKEGKAEVSDGELKKIKRSGRLEANGRRKKVENEEGEISNKNGGIEDRSKVAQTRTTKKINRARINNGDNAVNNRDNVVNNRDNNVVDNGDNNGVNNGDKIMVKKQVNNIKSRAIKSDPVRCSARIATGEQCMRNCLKGLDMCSCHSRHCPYGKADGPFEGKFLVLPRKRGPKIKNTKEYSLDELDTTLYQQTEMLKINGQHFLIDSWGILFKNDNNCEIVGRRVGNEIHWYC